MDPRDLARLCRLPAPDTDPVGAVLEYVERIGELEEIEPLTFATGPARPDVPGERGTPYGPFDVPVAGS